MYSFLDSNIVLHPDGRKSPASSTHRTAASAGMHLRIQWKFLGKNADPKQVVQHHPERGRFVWITRQPQEREGRGVQSSLSMAGMAWSGQIRWSRAPQRKHPQFPATKGGNTQADAGLARGPVSAGCPLSRGLRQHREGLAWPPCRQGEGLGEGWGALQNHCGVVSSTPPAPCCNNNDRTNAMPSSVSTLRPVSTWNPAMGEMSGIALRSDGFVGAITGYSGSL